MSSSAPPSSTSAGSMSSSVISARHACGRWATQTRAPSLAGKSCSLASGTSGISSDRSKGACGGRTGSCRPESASALEWTQGSLRRRRRREDKFTSSKSSKWRSKASGPWAARLSNAAAWWNPCVDSSGAGRSGSWCPPASSEASTAALLSMSSGASVRSSAPSAALADESGLVSSTGSVCEALVTRLTASAKGASVWAHRLMVILEGDDTSWSTSASGGWHWHCLMSSSVTCTVASCGT
mmetsp:Transcript_7615/g.17490  ORF Transcript_7615/g.17490 Transcript_7615/m.17490 type:complete len:240 (+) Transcript_7615:1010-1729(+)